MSDQSDALLGLVGAYYDVPEAVRQQREVRLFGNPVICTTLVWDLAYAEADAIDKATMDDLRDRGLIVVDDEPKTARARLSMRPGYENRAARRAHRRGGKGKVK